MELSLTSPNTPHILSVSYDPNLLNTRQLLLQSCGFTVTSAEGFVDALRKCRAGNYDLLIIGHSIPTEDKEAIIAEMGKHCPAPVLALLRDNEPEIKGASECVESRRPE